MNLNVRYTKCPVCKRFFGIEIQGEQSQSAVMLNMHWSQSEGKHCVKHTKEETGKIEGDYTDLPHLIEYASEVVKTLNKKDSMKVRF